ncbi:MAG: hypothetical protein JWM68_41 [Verrucomicrobiales bacterium]|nr:hypothetical protein [Verrucomicrobiales bacterium]
MKKLTAIAVNKHSDQDNRGLRVLNAKLIQLSGDPDSIAQLGKFFLNCAKEMRGPLPFHRHFRDFLAEWDPSLADIVVERAATNLKQSNKPNAAPAIAPRLQSKRRGRGLADSER